MELTINDPFVAPKWDDLPWALAFTTVAFENGETYNYKQDDSENKRAELTEALGVKAMGWLTLEHGNRVFSIPRDNANSDFADAAVVTAKGCAAAITTADCLPVIFVSPSSKIIAIAHAGWKGIVEGVLESTLDEMSKQDNFVFDDLRVWIGPSVRNDYEIRQDVKSALLSSPNVSQDNFVKINDEQFLADLPGISIQKMIAKGVREELIEIHPESTLASDRFFSVRKHGFDTGRMATVVGIV